jgi:hypothetical protein
MTAPIRNKSIPFREHCQRTSSLLEFAASQIRQSAIYLTTIGLRYPNLYVKWLAVGGQLVSLSQAMEAQSAYLLTMAARGSSAMDGAPISLEKALMIYSQLSEAKND